MYRNEHREQLSFKDFFLRFGGQLSGDNRWLKLYGLIPWDKQEMNMPLNFARAFVLRPTFFAWHLEP